MDEKNHNKTATPEQPAATLYCGWAGPRGAPGTGGPGQDARTGLWLQPDLCARPLQLQGPGQGALLAESSGPTAHLPRPAAYPEPACP